MKYREIKMYLYIYDNAFNIMYYHAMHNKKAAINSI